MPSKIIFFPLNKISTQTVEITEDHLKNGAIRVSGDIPKSLSLNVRKEMITQPRKLKVTLNGFRASESIQDLKINFKTAAGLKSDFEIVVKVEEDSGKNSNLECKICLVPFSENENSIPKVLACGHTLCYGCTKTLESKDKMTVQCPFDRKITRGQVEKFPKNYTLIDMIREKKSISDKTIKPEQFSNPLFPCFENEKHESEVHCKRCNADFCQSCFNTTHSSRILSSHTTTLVAHSQSNCDLHPDKKAEFVCKEKTCEFKVMCRYCMLRDHEGHRCHTMSVKGKNCS